MPVATPFTSFGSISDTDPNAVLFTGFPFLLEKVDVSDRGDGQPYDYWTTLGGYNKDDAAAFIEPTGIAESLEKAMKLFWNYNGHSVDVDLRGIQTLTIDIEQDAFDGGSATAPFEPKDRVCRSAWNAWVEFDDGGGFFADTEVAIYLRRMYNGSTDDEDNFVGYGVANSAFESTNINGEFRFYFSSYRDNEEPTEPWTFEYSEAIEEGMWFVASAEANGGSTSIDGLEATFSGTTITYKDFDFWTYPA